MKIEKNRRELCKVRLDVTNLNCRRFVVGELLTFVVEEIKFFIDKLAVLFAEDFFFVLSKRNEN